MISHIKDFELLWMQEFDKTQKVFKHIPDRALAQAVDSAGRTLGRLAWHIATTIPEMMGQTGLKVEGPHHEQPVPESMQEIRRAYEVGRAFCARSGEIAMDRCDFRSK